MKYLKGVSFLFILLLLFSCKGEDGADGGGGNNDTTTGTKYVLSGKFQKGPCYKNGNILIQPLDSSMNQTGAHYIGFTDNDLGGYTVPAEISELYAEVYFDGVCNNEVTGGEGNQKLDGIIKVTDLINNINPLTKIRSQVARDLFNNGFGDIPTSLIEAERLILLYLGMPVLTQRFTEMNLEQAGVHDAVLALSNSMILYGRTEAQQGDYMVGISNGIISNDLTLKAEIAATIGVLPLIQIKNNIESRYLALGLNMSVPPIWNLGAPAYYADLLERTPIVQGDFNLADNTTCNFDQSTYNTFAIPHVFDATDNIETSKYIAMNLDQDISIWTRGFNVYDRPGTKLLDITKLKEIILEDPVKLSYNGLLGAGHGLTGGTDYYIVIRSNTNFVLSTSCEGNLLPWGRKLASQDEGVSWIGSNNNTPWFRKSGLRIFTTD